MRTSFDALLADGQPIVADGGMGTMLFAQGLERGDSPERWNVERPDAIRAVQRAYIEAGAQIILTNTFGGNRYRLHEDLRERTTELNRAAAELARAEADAADHPVLVAGDIGPTGRLLEPLGDLAFEDAVAAFREQASGLAEGGVDVLWIETMSDLEDVRAAVEACRQVAPTRPVIATMTFDTKGRTMMGVTPEKALATLSELNVVALGANCGNGPDEIEGVIAKMHAAGTSLPLIAKANAGLPRLEAGVAVYHATPDVMGEYAGRVSELGARIVGACCGSTPEHIRAIAQRLRSN